MSNSTEVEATFIAFLARDMDENPQRLVSVDQVFLQRLHDLVGDVEIDLNAPLAADDN